MSKPAYPNLLKGYKILSRNHPKSRNRNLVLPNKNLPPGSWHPKWNTAVNIKGFGTRYDAYQHAGSWYDSPNTWVFAPRWHTIPNEKILIISTHTGKFVEVWIADYCACHGADRIQGTKDDSLVDLSPEVWAALGAFKDNKIPPWPYANTTPGFKNTIEVRFFPSK